MRRLNAGILIGIFLILAGLLMLLETLGYFGGAWQVIAALLFAGGSAAFFAVFIRNQEHWWSIIPGVVLIAISGLIFLDVVAPKAADTWGGSLFLGGIGLAFLIIFIIHREFWWAIIPAGVLATLAVVALLSNGTGEQFTGAIFFFGLALTFLILAFVPTPEGRLTWSFIPAGVLLVMGFVVLGGLEVILRYLFPAIMLAAGLLLLYRALRSSGM